MALFLATVSPEMQQELHSSGEKNYHLGNFVEAKRAYSDLVDTLRAPQAAAHLAEWQNYVDAYLRLGTLLFTLQEYEKAELLLEELLLKNPPPPLLPSIAVQLAKVYSALQKREKSFWVLKRAEELYPLKEWKADERSYTSALFFALEEYYGALFQKAHLLSHAQLYEEAIPLFKELLDAYERGLYQDPPLQRKRVEWRYAECLKKVDLLDEEGYAIKLSSYEEALQKEASDEYLLEMALHHVYQERKERAEPYLRRVMVQGSSKRAQMAQLYLADLSEQEEKIALLKELTLSLDPKNSLHHEATFLLADAYFQREDYLEAAKYFEKSISCPTFTSGQIALVLSRLGLSLLRTGREFQQAEKYLWKAFAYSDREEILFALAELYTTKYPHDYSIAKIEVLFAPFKKKLSPEGLEHLSQLVHADQKCASLSPSEHP